MELRSRQRVTNRLRPEKTLRIIQRVMASNRTKHLLRRRKDKSVSNWTDENFNKEDHLP